MGDTGEEGVKVMRKSQLLIVISYLLFVNNWKKLFVNGYSLLVGFMAKESQGIVISCWLIVIRAK